MIEILTLVIVLIVLLVALFQLDFAVALVCALLPLYLLRVEIFDIPTTALELSIYALVFVWLIRLWQKKIFLKDIPPWLIILGGLFIAVSGLAVLIAADTRIAAGLWKAYFVDPLLLSVVLVTSMRSVRQVRWCIYGLTAMASVLSVHAIWQFIVGEQLSFGRVASVFETANALALLLVPIALLLTALLTNKESKRISVYRGWLVAGLAVILIATFLTRSYAGWIALAAGFSMIIWLAIPRSRRFIAVVGMILAIIILIISQIGTEKVELFLDFADRSSSSARIEMYRTTLLILSEHPVLGVGLAFQQVYQEYLPRVASPPLEWNVVHPHNLWLAFWAELGIAGLAALLASLYLVGRWLAQSFYDARFSKNHWLGVGLAAAWLALLIHGIVDVPYFKNDLSVMFWLLISFVLVLRGGRENLTKRA